MPRMLSGLGNLRSRDFRSLTISTFFYFGGRWMEVVILGWLVLEISNSPFWVGTAGAFRFVGSALGPLAGTLSDRLGRRRILLIAQLVNALTASLLLTLLATDQLRLWQVLAAVLVSGCTFGVDFPSRNALVGEVVERRQLLNAIALLRAAQDLTSVTGAALGGSFIVLLGYPTAYGLVVALFAMNLLTLLTLSRIPPTNSAEGSSVWGELWRGLSYSFRELDVRAIMLLAILANLLAFPLLWSMMPVFARDVLQVGPGGLGALTAAVGLGALIGALLLAGLGSFGHRGKFLVAGFIFWPITLLLFAFSTWYPLSLGLLVASGFFQSLAMVSSIALLLIIVSEDMRGRVMGIRGLAIGALPIGSFAGGALTQQIGAPLTLTIFALLGLLSMGTMLLLAPGLRRWQ